MTKLTPVFVDFETFWSPTHSLTKMNPINYICHPDTEIISCAAKVGGQATCVSFGEPLIKKQMRNFDWSDKLFIAHNASGFDAPLAAWRLGVRPAMWGCTLAMARPHHSKTTGLSLAKLVEHYKLGAKNNAVLLNTKGRHLKDFTPEEIEQMRKYNGEDTDQCAALFYKLLPLTSKRELKLIDMTIRMLVSPKFRVDVPLIEDALKKERQQKHDSLLSLASMIDANEPGMTDDEVASAVKATLSSAPQFSTLLEKLDVEVPTKPSPSDEDKMIPALAKTDEGFIALQDHENPVVAAAAMARLGVKSTGLEGRLESFLEIAKVTGGRMPVPINYYGADTTGRDSGAFKINMQNLTRILPGVPKISDALRNCLMAPKYHKVVVADLSGIELRVNMHLWMVQYAMDLFKADPEKADLYRTLASEVLRVPYEEIVKMQRQAGKAMHLGCIAEGELVLTDHGLVPIEKVLTCMRVWDGVEWVHHEGPIFKGTQEVLSYAGLTATPDHIVFLRDGSSCRFDKAAEEVLEITRTGDGRAAIWASEDNLTGFREAREAALCQSPMSDVLTGERNRTTQPEAGGDLWVSAMQPTKGDTEMVRTAHDCDEATMHQPKRQGVQELWGTRDRVSIPVGNIGRDMGHQEPRAAQGSGVRSAGQQWALCSGESALGHRSDADDESEGNNGQGQNVLRDSGASPGSTVCGQHGAEPTEYVIGEADSGPMAQRKVMQTKRRVWDLLNAGPRNRFTVNGLLVHNCGFGLRSTKKYIAVAKSMAQIVVTEDEADFHILSYRAKHPEIVTGWDTCNNALPAIFHGAEYQIDPWGLCHTVKGGIKTPQGMIYYPDLRQEIGTRGRKEWVYGAGRHKTHIYGGKICENCIAEGTLVLTNNGWKPIEQISLLDLVHDGIRFVRHGGNVFKSVQQCVNVDGVYMTPDHEVLTYEGWKPAESSPRPFRPDIRGIELLDVPGHRRAPRAVGVPVHLRESHSKARSRCDRRGETRGVAELRMHDQGADQQREHDTWHDEASCVRGVSEHDRQMQIAFASRLEKLWGAWNSRVRTVATQFREILGGYGARISPRVRSGSLGQQRTVFAGELLVGSSKDQYAQQAEQSGAGCCNTCSGDGDCAFDAVLPASEGTGLERSGGQTQIHKVFDILNAGPRHRFVILGIEGPFVVHNCVQHLAREVVMDNALRIKKDLGFDTVHRVHDELIYVVPEGIADITLDAVQDIMRTPPTWWPELVVWSEGSTGDTYGSAK